MAVAFLHSRNHRPRSLLPAPHCGDSGGGSYASVRRASSWLQVFPGTGTTGYTALGLGGAVP